MPVGVTEASDVSQALAMPVQAAHEGGEVGCVCAWDLSCGREVL